MNQRKHKEEWTSHKANEVLSAFSSDLKLAAEFLTDRITLIDNNIENISTKRGAVSLALRSPQCGLNRTEANMMLSKLVPPPPPRSTTAVKRNSATSTSTRRGSRALNQQSSNLSSQSPPGSRRNSLTHLSSTAGALTGHLPMIEEYLNQVRNVIGCTFVSFGNIIFACR